MPIKQFMEKVKVMEQAFQLFHSNKVYIGRKPIEKLAEAIWLLKTTTDNTLGRSLLYEHQWEFVQHSRSGATYLII